MSGPGWAGTPIAYRVLDWAERHLREAHDALCIIREETPEGLYHATSCTAVAGTRWSNAGLLVVTAREFAKAAGFLAECSAELDSHSFATLQADTTPPTILPTEAPLAAVEVFLAAAEHALDLPTSPSQLDDPPPSCGWTSSSAPVASQLRSLSRAGGSTHRSRLSCRVRWRRSRRVASASATPSGGTRAGTVIGSRGAAGSRSATYRSGPGRAAERPPGDLNRATYDATGDRSERSSSDSRVGHMHAFSRLAHCALAAAITTRRRGRARVPEHPLAPSRGPRPRPASRRPATAGNHVARRLNRALARRGSGDGCAPFAR
jgi:hypothetical protein